MFSFLSLSLLWASLVWGAVTATGDAAAGTLWMQVLLAGLVTFQMVAGAVMKYVERRWAERDRQRDEDDRRAVAKEIKETQRLEAERVAKVQEQAKELIVQRIDENTEITKRNGHLDMFDKLLGALEAKSVTASDLRKLLHEGGEGRAQAADSSPGA